MREWIFERLDLDPALAGDLLEERRQGRSAIWYGRQLLFAVWSGIWNTIRDQKLLALRAVATGFAVEYFFIFLWKVWGTGLSNAVDLWLVLLTQTVAGWFVVRTHRAQPFPPLFAYLICSLFWFFGPPLWLKIIMDWDRIVPWSRASVLYNILADIFLTTAGILLGGILAHPKKPRSVPSNPNVT